MNLLKSIRLCCAAALCGTLFALPSTASAAVDTDGNPILDATQVSNVGTKLGTLFSSVADAAMSYVFVVVSGLIIVALVVAFLRFGWNQSRGATRG